MKHQLLFHITYESLDSKSPLRGHVLPYWTVNYYTKELQSYMRKKDIEY